MKVARTLLILLIAGTLTELATGKKKLSACKNPVMYRTLESVFLQSSQKQVLVRPKEVARMWQPTIKCWNDNVNTDEERPQWNCHDQEIVKTGDLRLENFTVECTECRVPESQLPDSLPCQVEFFEAETCFVEAHYSFTEQGRRKYQKEEGWLGGMITGAFLGIGAMAGIMVWAGQGLGG
ncbi:MAG: hypothetical protein LQ343_006744 [Gyalolechia ehrenbergii]|nr:MAG: hypothetical protein LQ343_006744 [Gyalolechia ehrenbergii]